MVASRGEICDEKEEGPSSVDPITQQLAHAGFSSNNTRATNERAPILQDLALWNILPFALDEKNYLNLMLVCKEWERRVKVLEPPLIHKISLALSKREKRGLNSLRKPLCC